jgi:hypothetical protein
MVQMAQATVKDTAFDGIYDWFKREKSDKYMHCAVVAMCANYFKV